MRWTIFPIIALMASAESTAQSGQQQVPWVSHEDVRISQSDTQFQLCTGGPVSYDPTMVEGPARPIVARLRQLRTQNTRVSLSNVADGVAIRVVTGSVVHFQGGPPTANWNECVAIEDIELITYADNTFTVRLKPEASARIGRKPSA